MQGNVTRRGLCTTCKHDPVCTYPRQADRPVLCCEEFCGDLPCPPFRGHAPAVEPPRSATPPEMDDSARYKGLCSNCDNLATCTYPKHEGGVWHCEEYR